MLEVPARLVDRMSAVKCDSVSDCLGGGGAFEVKTWFGRNRTRSCSVKMRIGGRSEQQSKVVLPNMSPASCSHTRIYCERIAVRCVNNVFDQHKC